VLIEFWTFTCINWIRTLPYVHSWSEKYRSNGLVVLGVHTPEFGVERDVENIRRAAKDMRIAYPIAIDSDYAIWRAFGNQYWPALYFADANGQIRHHRFGEGEYEHSELVIQALLKAAGAHEVSGESISVDALGVEAAADWHDLRSLRPTWDMHAPRTSPPPAARPGTGPASTGRPTSCISTTGRSWATGRSGDKQPCSMPREAGSRIASTRVIFTWSWRRRGTTSRCDFACSSMASHLEQPTESTPTSRAKAP
jgi:thiol-disulfide isomerase/thioredoxin